MDVNLQYDSVNNNLTWDYSQTLNFVDIYKIDENNTIKYSISGITGNSFTFSEGVYTINVSNIHLMGEEGITNENPYLLNTTSSSSYYMLGLSGPGITFFTTEKIIIDDNENKLDVSGIPVYNNLTNTISFYYNKSITGVDLYQVSSINNRRYIYASAQIPVTVDTHPLYTIDITGVTMHDDSNNVLPVSDGIYYLGVKSDIFTISGFFDITTNNISSQWNTVLEDNITLMKAGLYNTSSGSNAYHYVFPIQPTDLSEYSYTGSDMQPLSSGELNTLVVNTDTNKLVLNNTYNQKLGVNNAICDVFVGPTGGLDGPTCYIRTSSQYITLDKGIGLYKEFFITYEIEHYQNTLVVINPYTIAYYKLDKVRFFTFDAPSGYDTVDLFFETVPYKNIGNLMSSPWAGSDKIILKYINGNYDSLADWFVNKNPSGPPPTSVNVDVYTLNNNSNNPYTPQERDGDFILRIAGTDPTSVNSFKVKDSIVNSGTIPDTSLQWGSDSSTSQIKYGINYRSGLCTLNINIPASEAVGFTSDIYYITDGSTGEKKLDNSFVISSGCTFEDIYNPPSTAYTLDVIRYGQLGTVPLQYDNKSGIMNAGFYIPSMVPGGDYGIKYTETDGLTLYFVPGSDTKMTADRCRQPWRLSHYVRANNISSSETDIGVLKIAYNTAAALVYNASMDSIIPGRLSLSVDICNLTNTYDGYSGDMVPPLLALIDALAITNYDGLEAEIKNYATNVKSLNNSSTLNGLITNLETDTTASSTYPILDSLKSGGQQLGLAGCGFVCTKDFLSRPNFDVMAKYDNITTWDGSYNSYTRINQKIFTDDNFYNLITVYKMLAMRGNGFKTWANWPANNPLTKTWADCILSDAYVTNLRIRDINVLEDDELSFGPNVTNYQPITAKSYASGSDHPIGLPPIYTPNEYVYTHFPMIGIPDSGWGSLTIEIFSYLGIVFAAMNDYRMFCRWHRAYWHMLFIQNGGDMYGWDADGGIQKQDSDSNVHESNMWLPSYLQPDHSNGNQTWIPDIVNKYKLHFFTIYNWPPENWYPTNDEGIPQHNNKISVSKTNYWANRQCPYRGDDASGLKYRWSTPSYCMGYSPAWVAGGKTANPSNDEKKINRPVAEALNPFFTNSLGLYSATDGDQNILQAYLLASLQWGKNTPNLTELNQTSYNSTIHDKYSPLDPTQTGNADQIYGWDCDVCDLFYNTEIPDSKNNIGSVGKGVKWALDNNYGYQPSVNITVKNVVENKSLYVTDKIGYGVTRDGTSLKFATSTENGTTKRCTTWAYIAEAVQKTIISKNGCGFSSDFGNFAPIPEIQLADPLGARFETLGHDTNTGLTNTFKLDYIDTRIYQICKKLTQTL
jgi:hypothetical protein